MAADYFLKIDGIKGESLDDKHKDEIDVLSFSWGVSQSGSMAFGGGGGEGKASFHDLSFMHHIDKSSPVLMQSCANGTHIKEVKIELCRATGDKQKYMEYKMSDCIISSVRPGGSSQGGESLPLEEVSFNYGKIEPAAGGTVRQRAQIQQGIPQEKAKEVVKFIKDSKAKVQASIQGDVVRVSGRDRDTLQDIIAKLKDKDFGIHMQFTNYRSN